MLTNYSNDITIKVGGEQASEKAKAMERLLTELNKGFKSGEEDGWLSEDDVREHFLHGASDYMKTLFGKSEYELEDKG